MINLRTIVGVAAMFLAMYGLAAAQTNQNAQLDALEERVRTLESERAGEPTHDFQLSGYMSATFFEGENAVSNFSTSFSPIFLYKASKRFLFEAELSLGFDDEETKVELEYSQLDYMLGDNISLVAGKFLLPFGIFGERGHPSWINKMVTPPLIYSGHHGRTFHGAIIPILFDFGVQVRGGFKIGGTQWGYAVYAVNGPKARTSDGEDEHAHGAGDQFPVSWGPSAKDDNQNKATGLRIAFLPVSTIEIGLSHYSGKILYEKLDDEGQPPGPPAQAPIRLSMLDLTWRSGAFRLTLEYLNQDTSALEPYVEAVDPATGLVSEGVIPPDETVGWYVEASHRFATLEPVIRFGKVERDDVELGSQTSIGINWWIISSLVVKLSAVRDTEIEDGVEEEFDNVYAQMAFGF